MDYIKELDKNNVGLKTTLKKIFKDIDKRLKETSDDETSDDEETNDKRKLLNLIWEMDEWYLIDTSLSINGFITDMNSETEVPVDVPLDIIISNSNGNIEVETSISMTNGEFEYVYQSSKIGTYLITLSFKGDTTYAPFTETKSFEVVEESPDGG